MSSFLNDLLAQARDGSLQLTSAVGELRRSGGAAERTEARQRRRVRQRKRRLALKTVDQEVERWQMYRLKELGFKTIIEGHVCSMGICNASGSLVEIDSDLNLYGCVKSGIYHVCRSSMTLTCKETYTTTEGDILCVFSKRVVGRSADSSLYGERLEEHDFSSAMERAPNFRISVTAQRARNSARVAETASSEWASGSYGNLETSAASSSSAAAAAAAAAAASSTETLTSMTGIKLDVAHETTQREFRFTNGTDATLAYDDDVVLSPELTRAGIMPPRKRYRHGMLIDESKTIDYTPLLAASTTTTHAVRRIGASAAAPETFVSIDGTEQIEDIGQTAPTLLALAATEAQMNSQKQPSATSALSTPNGSNGLQVAISRQHMVSGVSAKIRKEYLHESTHADIQTIISTIFRSSFRAPLVRAYNKEINQTTQTALVRYMRQCHNASVRPCALVLMHIRHMHANRILNLSCPRGIPSELLKSYAAVTFYLWRTVMASAVYERQHTHFRLVDHVITVLYMLKDQLSIASANGGPPTVVFEKEPFLNNALPEYHVLRSWKIPFSMTVHTIAKVLTKNPMRKKYLDLSKTNLSGAQAALLQVLQEKTELGQDENLAKALSASFETGIVQFEP